ncbi:MAG: ADP-ribosylglycohydrolase family protein [Actinomycetota bacterium]|nr:ADP-ribosylglycohydrolase family protein [Actinomycetota bacterium]
MSVAAAHRRQRVLGAVVGWAAGDALGAPFEFGDPGQFSRRFPRPAYGSTTEMTGGRGWKPGEWTDDTQMGLLVAYSLLEHDGLDEADLYARFVRWLRGDPADVGHQTRVVLGSGLPWDRAARTHFDTGQLAAGNGSLMRTIPAAVYWSRRSPEATRDAARRISALTHGDPAAGDGCAIYHHLIAAALDGRDPLDALPGALADIPAERRDHWMAVCDPAWTPEQATEPNGAVWPTLGTALWALRSHSTFPVALRSVVDCGGDTDTIAAVAGGLIGAAQGVQAIPSRWATPLNGQLPGQRDPVPDLVGLMALAQRLDGEQTAGGEPGGEAGIDPVEVEPGLWVSDFFGATRAPRGALVISLCRTWGRLDHLDRRQVYLTDNAENLDVIAVINDVLATIEAAQSEGRPVLVHCYGGHSRTGLILRAYLMRKHSLNVRHATAAAQRLWPHLGLWEPTFDEALQCLAP